MPNYSGYPKVKGTQIDTLGCLYAKAKQVVNIYNRFSPLRGSNPLPTIRHLTFISVGGIIHIINYHN